MRRSIHIRLRTVAVMLMAFATLLGGGSLVSKPQTASADDVADHSVIVTPEGTNTVNGFNIVSSSFRVRFTDAGHYNCPGKDVASTDTGCEEDLYYIGGLTDGWTVEGGTAHGTDSDGTKLWQVRGDRLRGRVDHNMGNANGIKITPPTDWTGEIPIRVYREDSTNLITDFDNGTFDYIGEIPNGSTKDSSGKTISQMLPNYTFHDPRTQAVDLSHGNSQTGQWAPHDGQYSIWPTGTMNGPFGVYGINGKASEGTTWNNRWADLRSVTNPLSLNTFPSTRLWGDKVNNNNAYYWNGDRVNGVPQPGMPNDSTRMPLGINKTNAQDFGIPSSYDGVCKTDNTNYDKTLCDTQYYGDMGNDDTIKRAGKFLIVNGRDRPWGTDTIVNTAIAPRSTDGTMYVFHASLANLSYVAGVNPVSLTTYVADNKMDTHGASNVQNGWANKDTAWSSINSIVKPGSHQPFNLQIRNWGQSGYGNDFAIDNLILHPLVASTGTLKALKWDLSKTANPTSGSWIKSGDTITYTLKLTNTSAKNPTSARAATLPAGTVVTDDLSGVINAQTKAEWITGWVTSSAACTSSTGETCGDRGLDSYTNKLTWKLTKDLPAGESMAITYKVTVAAEPAVTSLKNSVYATPPSGTNVPPEHCTQSNPCSTEHFLELNAKLEKKWVINGTKYDQGSQPSGFSAQGTLSPNDRPGNENKRTPSWGETMTKDGKDIKFKIGDKVTLSETSTVPKSCKVTSNTVSGPGISGAQQFPSASGVAGAGGVVGTLAHTSTYTITNLVDCLSTVTWTKVGYPSTDNILGGSEWKLNGPDQPSEGTKITDCTSGDCSGTKDKDNAKGKFKLTGLKPGKYTLTETRAPAGYEIATSAKEFIITYDTADVNIGFIQNKQHKGPAIPFTGGTPADALVIGGVGATLVAGFGVMISIKKRQKALLTEKGTQRR